MEITITEQQNLATIANQINQEHANCQAAFTAGVQHALTAGELLLKAKALCAHGQWGQWLKDNITFSERTAQAYMKVAREIPALGGDEAQRVADLSFREVLGFLAKPIEVGGNSTATSEPEKEFPKDNTVLPVIVAEITIKRSRIKQDLENMFSLANDVEERLTVPQFRNWLQAELGYSLSEYEQVKSFAMEELT